MFITVVKQTNYDVKYLKSMPYFDFVELFETVIKMNKENEKRT